jgi:uncharacterized protein YecT (DUF1311 family)
MHIRSFSATLTLVGLLAVACDDATQEQSPGEVLARDTTLANDLRQADTSSFAEAADVAMAFDPDSAVQLATPPVTPSAAPATAVPRPAVPMRVDRSATSGATVRPEARPPLRPVPATIHPDPLPGPAMPAARTRARTSPPGGAALSPSATAILERVPGASLPAVPSDPCLSPAAADQRRCLMTRLARSDVGLDRTYRALIADLKRDAGTAAGAPEPQSVRELRQAQRAWLVYRDTECRRRNGDKEGALWAAVRAECLGEFSGVREAELARARRR